MRRTGPDPAIDNAEPFPGGLTRRSAMLGLLAGLLAPGLTRAATPGAVTGLLNKSGLQELSGFAVFDVTSGEALGAHRGGTGLPPASVLKSMTALYALDTLGPDYRFRTRLIATGPVEDGVVQGDLVLAGDGDPVLDTNALKRLVTGLAGAGVTGVTGRFLVADGALPVAEVTDAGQPMHVGYNPAISGLNLNFNRVRLEWKPEEGGTVFEFYAPGSGLKVNVDGIGGVLGEGPPPEHGMDEGREVWTLPGRHMKRPGKLWLPVRHPARHAGEVFRKLADEAGVTLPEAEVVGAAPEGEELAAHVSPDLVSVLRGMLRYSTNLTAEVVGLRASQARGLEPESLFASAAAMTDWARERYKLQNAVFVNHSGLSDRSVWSPEETVRVLSVESDRLPELLRQRPILDAKGNVLRAKDVRVVAKSGTLYFSSGLAGYVEGRGRQLAFAIYSVDPAKRETIDPKSASAPKGSRGWTGRARGLQNALLRTWVAEHLKNRPPPPLRPRARPVERRADAAGAL